jgi:hypothetical protein
MPRVGFEPIPASKRAKTVHALDHLATVTSKENFTVTHTHTHTHTHTRAQAHTPVYA